MFRFWISMTVFWDVASCSLAIAVMMEAVNTSETSINILGLPDYTTQHPRMQPSSYSSPWEPEISPCYVSASIFVQTGKENNKNTIWGSTIGNCSLRESNQVCPKYEICILGYSSIGSIGPLQCSTGSVLLHFCLLAASIIRVITHRKHLWNVGKLLPDYAVQQPRRQSSSYSPPWEPKISPSSRNISHR
jgi:hypothetical protein